MSSPAAGVLRRLMMTGNKTTAKRTTAKSPVAKEKAQPRAGSDSDRAAEVETNIGGSQPLREFLREVEWY
jgi:hypothetical protein